MSMLQAVLISLPALLVTTSTFIGSNRPDPWSSKTAALVFLFMSVVLGIRASKCMQERGTFRYGLWKTLSALAIAWATGAIVWIVMAKFNIPPCIGEENAESGLVTADTCLINALATAGIAPVLTSPYIVGLGVINGLLARRSAKMRPAAQG